MFDITNNNIISINRGDTLKYYYVVYLNDVSIDANPIWQVCPPALRNDDHIHSLEELGAILYFGVMEANQPFEDALIRKDFLTSVNGVVTIYLEPEMTEKLLTGTYYYSIKLLITKSPENSEADNEYTVLTLVPNTKFVISN